MKNVWKWIGIICLVAGSALACFTNIANDVPALFVAAFGFGALVVSTWEKSNKKWLDVLTLIFICIGGFACAVAGLSQDLGTTLIASIIAIVTLIIGIFGPTLIEKLKK